MTAVSDPPAVDGSAINPSHYGGAGDEYEVIRVLRAWLGVDAFRGFCKGNALKYIARAGRKEGEPASRDYRKAQWYLARLIELEGANE